ncbi:MAG: hypothetical protein DHS20C02_06340 [Micavibrio sp.]|nr:MAG: hypothetical protein DHS20C02_06340 [Micavibrio sp.]
MNTRLKDFLLRATAGNSENILSEWPDLYKKHQSLMGTDLSYQDLFRKVTEKRRTLDKKMDEIPTKGAQCPVSRSRALFNTAKTMMVLLPNARLVSNIGKENEELAKFYSDLDQSGAFQP